MKHIKIFFAIVLLGLMATSCSETLFDGFVSDGEGEKCELTLPIECALPEVKVVTRSGRTESEEKRLNDLQILIFSSSTGKLKGYKHIKTGDAELNSSTYEDGEGDYQPQNVTVKTTTGSSYVYAVANCSTQDYKITVPDDLKSYINENTGIFSFDEEKAQNGDYDFNLTHLQELGFSRVKGEIGINDGYFLMCGMIEASDGVAAAVNIKNENGNVYVESGNNLIKLRRMVAKVKFNIADKGVYTSNDTTYTFTLQSYDIIKVPTRGNLVQGMTASETADYENNVFEALTGLSPDQQTSDYTGFIVYLPENMQTKNRKNSVSNERQREANALHLDENNMHVFTNAPDDATYVILNGTYDETVNKSSIKSGNTSYMIHLGDFDVDMNDYNNERNYYYTYTIHVQGVNRFIAEAKRVGDSNPGAEGFISAYSNDGKKYSLDSHYEYCIMRFYQKDIVRLKNSGHGYSFAAYGLTQDGEMAETQRRIEVTSDTLAFDDSRLNGVDINWVHFFKNDASTYFDEDDDHGGTDPGFKHLWDSSIASKYKNLSVGSLLSLLYNNAATDSEWPYSDSNGPYVDYTCYVDENFYTGKTWDKFTNKSPRRLCIANDVYESEDGRTVYADGAFYVTQRAIQTFYNRDMSKSLTAYGCETIDETEECEGKDKTSFSNPSNSGGKWNGRTNMIEDNSYSTSGSSNWPTSYTFPNACMKRNRDLNHNGKIEDDEIRWYTPTVSQYTGLWIGQPALEEEAQLYYGKSTASPDIMHYYTSTSAARVFWAQEGMAAGNWIGNNESEYKIFVPKHIRCIRTLPQDVSNNRSGAADTPDKYYLVTKENGVSEPTASLSNQITYTYRDRGYNVTGNTGLYRNYTARIDNSAHYKIDMSRVDPTATTSQTKELAKHHEYEDGNKVAKTYYLANSYFLLNTDTVTGNDNKTYIGYSPIVTARNAYYYRTVTCGNKYDGWRVPNQRELAMMYIGYTDGTTSDNQSSTSMYLGDTEFCATYYSGMNYNVTKTYTRYSWKWTKNDGISMGDTGLPTSTGRVRCIKVVTE